MTQCSRCVKRVRYPALMNQTEADAWYSSWTDLSHDDFSSAMYSVNSIFAKHDLAAYSLQIPEMVGNLLNPRGPFRSL